MLDFFHRTTPQTAVAEAGAPASTDVAPEIVELRVQVDELRGVVERLADLVQRTTGGTHPELSVEARELRAQTEASAFYGAEEQP